MPKKNDGKTPEHSNLWTTITFKSKGLKTKANPKPLGQPLTKLNNELILTGHLKILNYLATLADFFFLLPFYHSISTFKQYAIRFNQFIDNNK